VDRQGCETALSDELKISAVAVASQRMGGLNRFFSGIRSDTNDYKSPRISQNPSCHLARIPLQTKNEVGELESPVIEQVFGTSLALFPRVTVSVEGKSPSQSWHKFNDGFF
jgi:hypothetical protein